MKKNGHYLSVDDAIKCGEMAFTYRYQQKKIWRDVYSLVPFSIASIHRYCEIYKKGLMKHGAQAGRDEVSKYIFDGICRRDDRVRFSNKPKGYKRGRFSRKQSKMLASISLWNKVLCNAF